MGKKCFFSFLLALCSLPILSQTYGNEWINYSQKYYRIFVIQDGIYHIDSLTMANAGIPIGSINPRNIQIFGRGKEEYIYIKGEASGVFNSNDTIEFYGRHNDGFLDSSLYNGAVQPNRYVSLFNDTAIYYLTWNQSLNNRRMVVRNDTSFSSYTPNAYVFKEDLNCSANTYFQGVTDETNITDPEYIATEAWVNPPTSFTSPPTVAGMQTNYAYAGGPPAVLTTRVLTGTQSYLTPSPDTHLTIQYPGGQFDTLFEGFTSFPFTRSFPASLLVPVTPITLTSAPNLGALSYGYAATTFVTIRYPHTPDLEGLAQFKMYVPAHGSPATSYLNLSDFNSMGSTLRFYDLTYHRRCRVIANGGNYQVLIGDSLGAGKLCVLTSDNNAIHVPLLQAVNENGSFTNFLLQKTDSAYVIVTNATLWSGANAYKQYRTSVQGGSNHVILADINELYDQFAYGVRMHPLSVRRFCGYLQSVYTTKPKSLFLIGKALNAVTQRGGGNLIMLPTFGYPASDNLFTAKLGTRSYAPSLATGRIASETNSEVITYLNKVSNYEQNVATGWMKQVLHFGGGESSAEQSQFKSYLTGFKNIIQSPANFFGGNVTSFFKTSTAPIQINQSDSLKRLIDNGVSIITFFGHSSGNGFDVTLDDPSNYLNAPRFPLIIANSCLAGDIHETGTPSTSEQFVNGPTGAIAFLACTALGLATELNTYTTGIYQSLARVNYGKSIGRHIQYTIQQMQASASFGLYYKLTALCMTLDGDPGLVIASPRLPDYAITPSDVNFNTLANSDSVLITAQMHNYGKSIIDSFFVRVLRQYANGDTDIYKMMVHAPAYIDSFHLQIPVDFNRGIGLNKISIYLDYTDRINEVTKSNNSTGTMSLLLQGNAVIPIWPYNDAIYPYDTVTLKASTANPLDPPRNYRLQFDTTDTYHSPFAKTTVLLNKPGGVICWKPPGGNLTDSTVYFFRITQDTVGTTKRAQWKECSFQYIAKTQRGNVTVLKRGWEQAQFFQFKNDNYQFVKFNRAARNFSFVNDVKSIEVDNAVMGAGGHDWPDNEYLINSVLQEQAACTYPGFSFAILNPYSITPWSFDTLCSSASFNQYTNPTLGNVVCDCGAPLRAYDFCDTSATTRAYMTSFLAAVPTGYYLIAWTNSWVNGWYGNPTGFDTVNGYSPAPGGLLDQFHKFGAVQINTLSTHNSYIMLGKKGGAPGSALEISSPNEGTKITLRDTLVTNWNSGFISSEIIGPAKSWDEFHIRKNHLFHPNHDSTWVQIIGIKASGAQVLLASLADSTHDMYNLASFVNANTYPYIRLVANMKNDTNRVPPQLKRWQVMYTQSPEMALNPAVNFSFKSDSVQEGQPLVMTCAVQNVSDLNFTDTLQINYWFLDKNHVKHNVILPGNKPYKLRKPPFNANTFFIDTVSVPTLGYGGLNTMWMEVNPLSTIHTEKEQYHFNNLLSKPFTVTTDKTNPLLDVTFDGVHILDNDIVSAKPNILVSLKDENQFLALNDTSDFKLFIQYPNSTVLNPVYFRNQITFTPAVLPHNSCKLNYIPSLTTDGTYLLVVQAKDRSNNASGKINYQINFDVINHATITDVMNYPNPFSTATHFVFTITGSEVPTMFRIQIITITGKLVREIERYELGPLHIGRNITEYAWDGRDQFGDRLANGVYFYRVLTKINEDNIEHADSGADQYFKKGFGKMYLMH